MSWPKIYIGRSLPRGKLEQYTVFANGIPAHVQKLIDTQPLLRELIVSVSNVQEARRQLATPASRLRTIEDKIFSK